MKLGEYDSRQPRAVVKLPHLRSRDAAIRFIAASVGRNWFA
jgi:hypothetical protein